MKGQVNQVFIYISALLFMALVLLFGIKTVVDFQAKSELVELTKFVNDFRSEINVYYNFDVGSTKDLSLIVPGKVKSICFVNLEKKINQELEEEFGFILEDNKQYNMFVLPLDAYPSPAPDFKVPHLDIQGDENPLCFDTSKGMLRAMIETKSGKDDFYVEIRKA